MRLPKCGCEKCHHPWAWCLYHGDTWQKCRNVGCPISSSHHLILEVILYPETPPKIEASSDQCWLMFCSDILIVSLCFGSYLREVCEKSRNAANFNSPASGSKMEKVLCSSAWVMALHHWRCLTLLTLCFGNRADSLAHRLTGMLGMLGLSNRHVYCCIFRRFWACFARVVQFYWPWGTFALAASMVRSTSG